MRTLKELFDNNRAWANAQLAENPDYFERLKNQQKPNYLWIGCADSRVPATQICGLQPGEIFVHRNIANVVCHTDLNVLSVIHYAVEYLKVEHIIVCGHYGCGGVQAAMGDQELGLIDNWLREIRDVAGSHAPELRAIEDPKARANRLCELNVASQVRNVCATSIIQRAWSEGRNVCVHGWIYDIADGLLRDLNLCFSGSEQLPEAYRLDHG